MKGKVLFSLNLFPTNEACRAVYYALPDDPIYGKPLFDRAPGDNPLAAAKSNYTALMEADGISAIHTGRYGLLLRWIFVN